MLDKPVVRRSFSRRRFFGGLGGGALIAYPLLRAHRVGAAAQPKVVILWSGGGMAHNLWSQTLSHGASLVDSTLANGFDVFEQPQWKPLKSKLTILDGLVQNWALRGALQLSQHGHGGMTSLIAATDLQDGKYVVPAYNKFTNLPLSMDRLLASKWSDSLFPSVRLKILRGEYDHTVPSIGGSASLSKTFNSLGDAYNGLFGGGTASSAPVPAGSMAGPSKDLLMRRDILGQSMEECKAVVTEVQRQLGTAAVQRVQNHCDSLREMEKRIDAAISGVGQGAASCKSQPVVSGGPIKWPFYLDSIAAAANHATIATKAELDAAPDLVPTMDAFSLLTANALACGRTRVVLHELWSDSPENSIYFLGRQWSQANIHGWIFHGDSRQSPMHNAYARWLLSRFATLGKNLSDLGLMDDTLLFYACSDPDGSHSFTAPAPAFYMGHGGGRFATGKFLKYDKASGFGINDYYTSIMRGLGFPMDRYGNDNSGRARYGLDSDMLV